jgi:PAS domain S-box-containing protein
MVEDITEKKAAEEARRESEEKFRSVFRDAGVGMVIVSPEGRFLAVNLTFCDYLGYTEKEMLAKTVESVTLPEDWPSFSKKLGEAITGGIGLWRFEKRCLHKSGRIVYTESSASLIRDRSGEPKYFVGGVLDVTKRKESEETLSGMTRKLVEAQEQERARIGRELHDDINQRLAMLAVELEQLKENPTQVETRAQTLREQITEISNDVQSLSHDLHSSKLDYLGVVGGIKSWCREFAERQKMEVDCKSDVRRALPLEVGRPLFRVLQEALQNASKHSGVKHVEVQLRERHGEIRLTVKDLGRGFDVETAKQGRGLGLTTMSERVRLVNGTIAIESKPKAGTTIRVRVPLPSEQDPRRAAV